MEPVLNAFQIRRLHAADSLDDLTSLLHRAFSPMGRDGIVCTCYNQSVDVTAQRVQMGECFVATQDGRLVGTMTLHRPEKFSPCHWYRQADVASLHQFAVDPVCQGTGRGTRLLRFALDWADEQGFHALALDTPLPAVQLIRFYQAHGFRPVEHVRFAGRNYTSCVLSQTIGSATRAGWPQYSHQPVLRKPLSTFSSARASVARM